MALSKMLRESNYTVILTGAGMSTESGLPDFRSARTGLWEQEDPAKLASTEALNRNVENFFQFYRQRVVSLKQHEPHEGYRILTKWEKEGHIQSIITQNVDGFHEEAGSENVAELHGTLKKLHCQSCKKEYENDEFIDENFYCQCGGKLRPSVVLFGEMLPEEAILKAAIESEKAELFIVLGSSLSVSPANQFPLVAKQKGAKLVIINMDETDYDMYADLLIHERKIGEVLAEADEQLQQDKSDYC